MKIEVTGATLVPQSDIQSAIAGLVGKPSDLAVLCEARDRVARLYAARGEALARVDLPEQRMSEGVLTLAVTEGRIVDTEIRNSAAAGPAAARVAGYFRQLEAAGVARWSDVERAFLLTREVPGLDAGFSIRRAGDGTPNGLVAVAALAPRRLFDITFNGHNLGSRELGREGATVRIDANGFTPLAERTSFIASTSSNGGQWVFQLLEEFRIGSSGTVILSDLAYSKSRPEGALEVLDLEGRAWVGRLGARHPLVRTRALSTDVSAKFEYIDQKNDLGFLSGPGSEPLTLFRDELRVLSAQLLNRWQPLSHRGLAVTTDLELRKGLHGLGASDPGDPLLSRADARPDFFAARFAASARFVPATSGRLVPWVSATLSGQWSPHSLPAYEEYQIGNYTVGRGYDPGAASGDRGLGLQLEAGAEVPVREIGPVLGDGAFGLFGFYDTARIWNEEPLSYDSTIASIGGGLRVRFPRTQLSLFYADPRKAPFPSAEKPGGRMIVTLTRTFSIR
jgi:hemolysin activation/secretion protein